MRTSRVRSEGDRTDQLCDDYAADCLSAAPLEERRLRQSPEFMQNQAEQAKTSESLLGGDRVDRSVVLTMNGV